MMPNLGIEHLRPILLLLVATAMHMQLCKVHLAILTNNAYSSCHWMAQCDMPFLYQTTV